MLNSVRGNFSVELPTRHARSRRVLQNDPRFVAWAVELLALAVQEETAARSFLSPEWRHYSRRIAAAQSGAPLSPGRLRALLEEVPDSASASFQELSCVLAEPDLKTFAEFAWRLARRCLEQNRFPQLAHALLVFAAEPSATRIRAMSLLRVLESGGSFFEQLEFQGPRLLGELVNPFFLGSFALAGIASRAASLAVLARVPRFSWGAFAASEAAAWAVEVPTLVLSHRLGMQLFTDADAFSNPRQVGAEMLTAAGPFLFLRIASNAFSFAAPALRRPLLDSSGKLSSWREGVMQGARWGTELTAMMAGNAWNGAYGLAPGLNAWQNFQLSFLSVGHMRLAGHLIHRAGMDGLSSALGAYKSRLMLERSVSFQKPSGPWGGVFEPALAFGGGSEASFSRARREKSLQSPRDLYMAASGSGEEGNGGGERPKEPGKSALLAEALRMDLKTYMAEVGLQRKLVARVTRALESLLARYSEGSSQLRDPAFRQQLEELRGSLAQARAGDSVVQNVWRTLQVLLRSYSASGSPTEREAAQALEKDLKASGDDIAAAGRELDRILDEVGSSDSAPNLGRARSYLAGIRSKLGVLYQGVRSRSATRPNPMPAVHGALTGLSAPGEDFGSSLMARLLGEPLGNAILDPALNQLHEAMYLAALNGFNSAKAQEAIREWAGRFGVSLKSTSAMLLAAEALQHLSERALEPRELLAALRRNPAARGLKEDLDSLESLFSVDTPLEDIFPILIAESTQPPATDYLLSGLFVMLRSGGSSEKLIQDLRAARDLRQVGFHPSIALSFFGAAHGAESLPREFLPPASRLDAFLRQALGPSVKK